MTRTNLISIQQQYRTRNVPVKMLPLDCKIDVLQSVETEVNGIITRSSKYVTDDSSHRYDGMKASDFEPQNLEAAGVEAQPVKFQLNSFESVAYAERQVAGIASALSKLHQSDKNSE